MSEQKEPKEAILKVSNSTDVKKLSMSIISQYQNSPDDILILRAIGAGALNQAIKGAIITNKFFIKRGLMVSLVPAFNDLNQETTSIELRLKLFRP